MQRWLLTGWGRIIWMSTRDIRWCYLIRFVLPNWIRCCRRHRSFIHRNQWRRRIDFYFCRTVCHMERWRHDWAFVRIRFNGTPINSDGRRRKLFGTTSVTICSVSLRLECKLGQGQTYRIHLCVEGKWQRLWRRCHGGNFWRRAKTFGVFITQRSSRTIIALFIDNLCIIICCRRWRMACSVCNWGWRAVHIRRHCSDIIARICGRSTDF